MLRWLLELEQRQLSLRAELRDARTRLRELEHGAQLPAELTAQLGCIVEEAQQRLAGEWDDAARRISATLAAADATCALVRRTADEEAARLRGIAALLRAGLPVGSLTSERPIDADLATSPSGAGSSVAV